MILNKRYKDDFLKNFRIFLLICLKKYYKYPFIVLCFMYFVFIFKGDITTSAILHLASTVPRKLQFSATDFNSYNTVASGLFLSPHKDGVRSSNGQKMSVPKSHPGLGIEPNWKILGEPLFVIQ